MQRSFQTIVTYFLTAIYITQASQYAHYVILLAWRFFWYYVTPSSFQKRVPYFSNKKGGLIMWKKRLGQILRKNVVCSYESLFCTIMLGSTVVLSECIPVFVHSYLRLLIIENFYMSEVTILWKIFLYGTA